MNFNRKKENLFDALAKKVIFGSTLNTKRGTMSKNNIQVHNPHDSLFKAMMKDKQVAADLLSKAI